MAKAGDWQHNADGSWWLIGTPFVLRRVEDWIPAGMGRKRTIYRWELYKGRHKVHEVMPSGLLRYAMAQAADWARESK